MPNLLRHLTNHNGSSIDPRKSQTMTQLTPQEIAAADQIIDIAPEATDLISLG